MIPRAASSSRTHWWPPRLASPQLMQPSVIADTSRPVLPSLTYFIASPSQAPVASGQPDELLATVDQLVVVDGPDRRSGGDQTADGHQSRGHRMALGVRPRLPGLLGELAEQPVCPLELGGPDPESEQHRRDGQRPGEHRQRETAGDADQAGEEDPGPPGMPDARLPADPVPPGPTFDGSLTTEHVLPLVALRARGHVAPGVGSSGDTRMTLETHVKCPRPGPPGPGRGSTRAVRPRSRSAPPTTRWCSPRSCVAWPARPPGPAAAARPRRTTPPPCPGPGC